MARVGVALGSNLGDRLSHLRSALDALREIATPGEPFFQAGIYRTEPLLCPPGSPYFYNSVVEFTFNGSAQRLLALTQLIEKNLGRSAVSERNAPRVIDVDLLYFGECILDREDLVLPHPRICERRFVLQPLADIRPELVIPGQTLNVASLLQNLNTAEPLLLRVECSPENSGTL